MTEFDKNKLNHLRALIDYPDLTETSYRLIRKVATGGMGTVFLVEDTRLSRQVALKVLTIPDATNAMSERMVREAHTVARLEHPGIVPIHEVGRLSDNRVYYTMKYVEGVTLAEHVTRDNNLHGMLRLFQRVCEAVAFAHDRGVVHRDIKPPNIMIGPFGEVLVMDWGIAAWSKTHTDSQPQNDQRQPSHATSPGTIVGTPAYMSPEQAEGGTTVDHRADIYALGAVLYFILTGQGPFDHVAPDRILSAVAAGDFLSPRKVNPKIDRRIEAICLRAMNRVPNNRYRSAVALSEDIARWFDGLPVDAYRDSLVEKASRWLGRNQFIVLIILTYIVVRFVVLFWLGY